MPRSDHVVAETRRRYWMVDAILAAGSAAIAFMATFHRLDISAWFDETYSYGMATQSLGSFFSRWVWGPESNMLLYYLTLRAWLRLVAVVGAAPTEVLLRMPSAVFAVAAAVVVFFIGRHLFGRVAGLVAASLYSVNFLQLILAQNARAYTLQLFLIALSWLALFMAVETNRSRWWVMYSGVTVLSVYTALFSGLVIASQVVALGALLVLPGPWRDQVRRAIRQIAASLTVSFVLVLPILVDAIVHGGPVWVPPAHVSDLKSFLFFMSGDSRVYELLAFGAVALALILAVAAQFPRLRSVTRCTGRSLGAAIAIGSWLVVPVGLSFLLTQPRLNLHLFFPRYLVVVVPPLCLLVGLAAGSLPRWPLQALAALSLALAAWNPMILYYELAQVQDFKGPVTWIQQRYQPGDGVVCDPAVGCAIPMSYYFAAYPGRAHLDADSPGFFSWETNGSIPVTPESIRSYESQHRRIFFIYAPLDKGASADTATAELQAVLTSDGYQPIARVQSHATGADTTVVLFASS